MVAIAISLGIMVVVTMGMTICINVMTETTANLNMYQQVAQAYTKMRENSEMHPVNWRNNRPAWLWYESERSDDIIGSDGEIITYNRQSVFPHVAWHVPSDPAKQFNLTSTTNDDHAILQGIVKRYWAGSQYLPGEPGKLPRVLTSAQPTSRISGVDQVHELELYRVNQGETPDSRLTYARTFVIRFWVY